MQRCATVGSSVPPCPSPTTPFRDTSRSPSRPRPGLATRRWAVRFTPQDRPRGPSFAASEANVGFRAESRR
jgi:hypothetical protein